MTNILLICILIGLGFVNANLTEIINQLKKKQ